MLVTCPHCSRVLDFSGEPPSFCAYCGERLRDPRFAETVSMPRPLLAAPLDLASSQLIEWGGAQRWLHTAAPAAAMRAAAAAAGGHATLFRAGAAPLARDAVFHPLTPAVAGIQRRLRQAFDPAGIFNPGRLGLDN